MDKRFDELYHLYAKDIYRIVYSYLLNEPDSEDVIQKTFIKLYNNKQKLSLPDEDVKRWLFRVAINEAKDILRSPWKKFISKLDINHTNVSNEKEDTLIDSLNNIASEYRIPLYLFYYEGYSIKEIAALLHKSESAIKMRLSRGKEKIKNGSGGNYMKRLESQYKKHFDNIDWSSEKEESLKISIINGYKKKQRKRKILYSIVIIFSILLVGTGVTYADDIKESINNIVAKIRNEKTPSGVPYTNYRIESEARKKLNYDAKLSEPKCTKFVDEYLGISDNDECYSIYTYEELEDALGIKILKNDLFKHNEFILKRLSRVDGKISFIELQMINPMDAKKNSTEITDINFTIYMRTKYHKSKNNTLWGGNYSSKDNVREYIIQNLKNKAYGNTAGSFGRNVFLVHDDIAYRLKMFVGGENIKTPDKEVQRILEAFHY